MAEMADADRSSWSWFPPVFVLAFSLLSFAGTYIGLRDIIATGDLRYGVFGDALVFVLVALATGAMVYFLRRATVNLASIGGVASLVAYLGLLFFSVTFGFAFYWGRLEASGQAIEGAQTEIEAFSDEIQISALTLQATADSLTRLSDDFRQLAVRERLQGGTCGDGSAAGPGPRMRHRERRAEEIAARVTEIQPRFAAVQGPVAILEAELVKIEALRAPETRPSGDPSAAREAQFQETRRAARAAAVEINALAADPALIALGEEFKLWGAEYQDPRLVRQDDPLGAPYRCTEIGAGRQLETAGERLTGLPRVAAPDLPDYVGAEATREAVFRMLDTAGGAAGAAAAGPALLWTAFAGSDGSGPSGPEGSGPEGSGPDGSGPDGSGPRSDGPRGPSADAVGAAAPDASQRGLTAQDRFPLAVALIIDALLFAFVLIERPGGRYFDRMRRRVTEAAREEFNPMRMVALRQALDEDPDWELLNRYRFDVDERTFIALPTLAWAEKEADDVIDLHPADPGPALHSPAALRAQSRAADPMDRIEILALRDVLKIFHRNGVVRPVSFKPERLPRLLLDAGRRDLVTEWAGFDCYEFTPAGFERLLLSGMTRAQHADLAWRDQGRAASRDDDRPGAIRAAE
ncbi:MAG: hypothetical protein AAGM38_11555 [Pseudomonadota bacterium]